MWNHSILTAILTGIASGHVAYMVMVPTTSPLAMATGVGIMIFIAATLIISIVKTVVAEMKNP